MLAVALGEIVASPTEHAQRFVTAEHQVPVFHGDVEDVALADSEGSAKVGREHDTPERVDAARAVLRGHRNTARSTDMWSVL